MSYLKLNLEYRGRVAGGHGPPPGGRFLRALEYALEAHSGQTRKGKNAPYAGHLLGVAALVMENGGDEDQAIAALLHDAAEDAGGRERLEDVRARFGNRVAGIVEGCTDAWETPKPHWHERKQAHLDRLRQVDEDTLFVSLADKLYNTRTILLDQTAAGEQVWDRFSASPEDLIRYYRELAKVYQERIPGPMADELRRTIQRIRKRRKRARKA